VDLPSFYGIAVPVLDGARYPTQPWDLRAMPFGLPSSARRVDFCSLFYLRRGKGAVFFYVVGPPSRKANF